MFHYSETNKVMRAQKQVMYILGDFVGFSLRNKELIVGGQRKR